MSFVIIIDVLNSGVSINGGSTVYTNREWLEPWLDIEPLYADDHYSGHEAVS